MSPDIASDDAVGTRRGGPVLVVAGPTASGKSSLAARVARALESPIVSADAMQVYRGMDIGTAKERVVGVDTRMIDVCDLRDAYSVALYQRDARACVDAALARGVVPVVCGGTGQYVDAIIDDIDFPRGDAHSAARMRWEAYAKTQGATAIHAELARRDPAGAALIHPNNVRRVIRALELHEGGVSYAEQNRGLRRRRPYYDARVFALTMDRGRLYARIDARVDAMFAAGLVTEVRGLVGQGLRDARTARQAIGYKEVLDYLDGMSTLAEAVELVKRRSRRYAKRQLSWLRRRDDVTWLDRDALGDEAIVSTLLEGACASAAVPSAAVRASSQEGA